MKRFSLTGNFMNPDYIKDGTFKHYIICLVDDIFVDVYCSFSLIQVISILTEKDYNIVYNEFGDKEAISRNKIIKITEVK